MKRLAAVAVAMVAGLPASTDAAPPTSGTADRIAVLTPADDGLPAAVRARLAETVETGLARTGASVLTAADGAAIDPEAVRCAASSCAGAAAASLGVRHVVYTTIKTEGRDHTIDVTVADASGSVVGMVTELCEICGQEELLETLEAAATRIGESIRKEGTPARLAVTSDPSGADVRIDGATVGRTPLELELEPGEHDVVVSKSGYLDYADRIRAAKGVRFPLEVTLPRAPDRVKERAKAGTLGYVAIGVGAAAAIAGAALMVIDGRPITSNCSGENIDPDGDCKFVYTTMAGGAALLGGGVAALGTGVGLVVWSKKEPRSNARAFGVGFRMRF